jgi:hypothetical protein
MQPDIRLDLLCPAQEGRAALVYYILKGALSLFTLCSEVNNPSMQIHKRDWAVSD